MRKENFKENKVINLCLQIYSYPVFFSVKKWHLNNERFENV